MEEPEDSITSANDSTSNATNEPLKPRRIRKPGIPRHGGRPPTNRLSRGPVKRQRQLDALNKANEARKNGKKNAPWGSRRESGTRPAANPP